MAPLNRKARLRMYRLFTIIFVILFVGTLALSLIVMNVAPSTNR